MGKELFRQAKRLAPGLPFDAADVLVIDEMGKDISGTGFDTKVVGCWVLIEMAIWKHFNPIAAARLGAY